MINYSNLEERLEQRNLIISFVERALINVALLCHFEEIKRDDFVEGTHILEKAMGCKDIYGSLKSYFVEEHEMPMELADSFTRAVYWHIIISKKYFQQINVRTDLPSVWVSTNGTPMKFLTDKKFRFENAKIITLKYQEMLNSNLKKFNFSLFQN